MDRLPNVIILCSILTLGWLKIKQMFLLKYLSFFNNENSHFYLWYYFSWGCSTSLLLDLYMIFIIWQKLVLRFKCKYFHFFEFQFTTNFQKNLCISWLPLCTKKLHRWETLNLLTCANSSIDNLPPPLYTRVFLKENNLAKICLKSKFLKVLLPPF